ncbi:MAG: DsrE family protein [Marinicella sp.]
MKFCLIINATDQWKKSLEHAFSMIKTMDNEGHTINAVFFYGQAVQIINDRQLIQQWRQLHLNTHCQLMLCSTMIKSNNLNTQAHLIKGFDVVGMASWIQAMEAADKTLELC